MPNSGEPFESYVQYVYRTLLNLHGQDIVVARRAQVIDTRGNTYNIDIFYEYVLAGVRHRVAIECKDTKRPIERDEVIAFAGKIADMPSTIGVFVSKNGFQAGARKYLEDHGILHLAGDDLPDFGSLLGARIVAVALPETSAIGQPFWAIMQVKGSEVTGRWFSLPDRKDLLPLFLSRRHAVEFLKAIQADVPDACVRGVEQPLLRLMISAAESTQRAFALLQPFEEDDRVKFKCAELTPDEVADDFLVIDVIPDRTSQ